MSLLAPKSDPIYVDLDDEVTTIFAQIRKSPSKKITLVIPARAQILQSLVSLKILRFKSEHAGKILTVVTKDSAGRALAAEAGLPTLENLRSKNSPPKISAPDDSPKKISHRKFKIISLAAKVFPKLQKISRDEIPLANVDFKNSAQKIWHRISGAASVEEISDDGNSTLVVRAPSRKILFGLLAGGVALLFFIVYIAVPSATIYVTPRADPISKVVNVNFTDRASSGSAISGTHTVAAEFLEINFARDIRIGATGQIFTGQNARGEITLFNRSTREKFIVPSRLKSPEGIIFHTTRALTIPAAAGDEYGSITAEVVACETDDPDCDCINEPEECAGNFTGSRGNLAPTFFTFPAIPSLSPALFWGESKNSFTGGVTEITKFISTDDLANVDATVAHEIQNLAREELQNLIDQKNALENRNLVLLDDARAIELEIFSIDVPPDLENSEQNDFAVAVSARVRAVAFDSDDLRALLFNQLETKVHPEKTLTKINFANAALEIEETDFDAGRVKAAVTIDGVEEYDISTETVAGGRLVEKIRARILGRAVAEAEAYVRNLPEISNAIISSWPFWARTIPELSENVKFRVKR